MTGIVGLAGPCADRPDAGRILDAMADPLARRPQPVPVDRICAARGILAAAVNSDAPDTVCRVAWSPCGKLVLLFLGEEFELQATADELRAQGHRFDDGLQNILSRYERAGAACLAELNGSFSGLLLDLRAGRSILFNDRFGLGRIYCHESADGLYFASEARALLAILPSARRLDPKGLAELFALGCVVQNRTLFAGVTLLPPAAQWTVDPGGRIDKARYFDPQAWESQPILAEHEYAGQLKSACDRVVPRFLSGRSPVGLSITGGIDSRLVLAWASPPPGTLPCYTFGGTYRDCADVSIGRRLARICGQSHRTIPIGSEFLAEFPALADQAIEVSDGTMDVSGAVELYANRAARAIAPVRLTGNYGSEILRSHVAFRPRRLDASLFQPEFNERMAEAASTYEQEAQGHRLSFIAFKQVPWHHFGRRTVEKSQLAPRSPFLDHRLVKLAYRAPPTPDGGARRLLKLINERQPAFAAVASDRALRSGQRSVPGFLANRWQEFTAKAEYAYDYGMPAWLVAPDHHLRRLGLERLVLGRHKFYHFRIWYKEQLRDSVARIGSDTGFASACYREGVVERTARDHLNGRANRTTALHQMLTLDAIDRVLLRRSWAI